MKKSFAYLAASLLLLVCLSGCGNSNMDNTIGVSPVPTAMPSASPYASPNANDGIVNDRDGIIEDRDTGGTYDDNDGILNGDRNGTGILDDNVTGNGTTNNGNGNHVGGTVSPSPSATANPNK